MPELLDSIWLWLCKLLKLGMLWATDLHCAMLVDWFALWYVSGLICIVRYWFATIDLQMVRESWALLGLDLLSCILLWYELHLHWSDWVARYWFLSVKWVHLWFQQACNVLWYLTLKKKLRTRLNIVPLYHMSMNPRRIRIAYAILLPCTSFLPTGLVRPSWQM